MCFPWNKADFSLFDTTIEILFPDCAIMSLQKQQRDVFHVYIRDVFDAVDCSPWKAMLQ